MKQNYLKLGLLLSLGLLANTTQAQTLTGTDVGSPSQPGSVKYDAATKVYTVVGGGSDIWNASDNFFYAYFKVTGDFDYITQVTSHIGNSGDGGWSKAELMAREDDGSGAPSGGDPFIANMANRPSSDTANGAPAGVNNRGPQWRSIRDNQCSWTTPNPPYPPNAANNWLRLERSGNVFYMYTSDDGKAWKMYTPYDPQGWDTSGSWPPGADNAAVASFTNAWAKTVLLGLAVTAHNDADVSTVKFANFGPYTGTPVAITTQPAASVNIAANAKFTLSVGATGDPVHYEWRKDGKAIARAVGPTYTVALAKTSDSGSYTVRVYGGGKEVISSASVVAVTVDTTPPTVKAVAADASFTGLRVEFSEPVTDTALTKGNFAMDGGLTISSVTRVNESTIAFVTSKMAEGASYTLTINGVKDTASPANTIAADTKVPFFAAKFATGFATYQRWDNANGQDYSLVDFATAVTDGTIRSADISSTVAQFGGPWGLADNYSSRVSGFFVPPTSGDYVFFLSSDDGSYLYLSTDDKPANKKLIANETGWSNQYQWQTVGGGSTVEDKRSDLFSASEWPTPGKITLKAGVKYFMEILEDEGGGGDGSDATYIMAGDADPTQDSAGMRLRGNVIGTYVDINGARANITTAPASVQGVEGHTAAFSVKADTFSPLTTTVAYQWLKNGQPITGATSPAYTTPKLALTDGAKYSVTVSVPGISTTSAEAVLTVVADTFPPKPLASALKNQAGTYDVGIAFDEDVDAVEVVKQANYSISAGTITAFKGYKTGAALTVTGLAPGTTYTVTVKNVADLKGNKIVTATVDFTVGKMAWGVVGGERLKLGNNVIASGEGSFDVYSDGATEWNNYDEATFVYEQITGDFDKKLRVEYQDSSSQWARAGLIARDVTNFGVTDAEQFGSQAEGNGGVAPFDGKACRYQKVHVNPVRTVMDTAGNNAWEGNRRLDTGGPSSSAGGGGNPQYPNAWCRLQRVGDLFTIYRSDDGVNWIQLGTTTFPEPMPATLFVGPDYSPENGNISDEALRGVWLAKFRDYGDTFPKTTVVTLGSVRTATGLTITFTGKLQSAPAVTGPWTDVAGAASPLAITTAGKASAFYRAAQ